MSTEEKELENNIKTEYDSEAKKENTSIEKIKEYLKTHCAAIVIFGCAVVFLFGFAFLGLMNDEGTDVVNYSRSDSYSPFEETETTSLQNNYQTSDAETVSTDSLSEIDSSSNIISSENSSQLQVEATTVPVTETAETTVQTTTEAIEASVTVTFPIDINLVTYDELLYIDGVGEATAQKIINFRSQKGKITSIDQLAEIDGIGEKTVAKLKNYLYVSDSDYVEYTSKTTTSKTTTAAASTTKKTTTKKTTTTKTTTKTTTTAAPQYSYVHINYADAEEISQALLLSIETAEEIVELRELISYFSSVEELQYVDSLSKSDISAFKEYVIID